MFKISTIDEVKESLTHDGGSKNTKRRGAKIPRSIYDDEEDLVIFSKYSYEKEDADEERMVSYSGYSILIDEVLCREDETMLLK